MQQANVSRGFTLIELLTVIAIIGLLSAIILAALNTARLSARDANIKGNSHTVSAQSQLYYDTNGTFGSFSTSTVIVKGNPCGGSGLFSDPTVIAATKAISSISGSATLNSVPNSYVLCVASGPYWEVVSPLASNPAKSWCIGNNGKPNLYPSVFFNSPPSPIC